jgi:hypothetical protein
MCLRPEAQNPTQLQTKNRHLPTLQEKTQPARKTKRLTVGQKHPAANLPRRNKLRLESKNSCVTSLALSSASPRSPAVNVQRQVVSITRTLSEEQVLQ